MVFLFSLTIPKKWKGVEVRVKTRGVGWNNDRQFLWFLRFTPHLGTQCILVSWALVIRSCSETLTCLILPCNSQSFRKEQLTCLCKSTYKINQLLVTASGSSQASSDTLNQRSFCKFSNIRAKQLMFMHYPQKNQRENIIYPKFGKYELLVA